jgi:UDP-glucose 4-epimerase
VTSVDRSGCVLVTGGAGFIGSHVVDGLLAAGYECRVIDDLSTGRFTNIREHVKEGSVGFFEGDIRDAEAVGKSMHDASAVVHLAAVTSVPFSVEHPDLTRDINVRGTVTLLDSCVKSGIEKLVLVSSCSVYGQPDYLPIDENHRTCPCSPYAGSKLVAEEECERFREKYGLDLTVLRLFNVYGPRQGWSPYSAVIAQFVDRVRHRMPLVIFGDGSQTRDFVHVSDVAGVVQRALESHGTEGGFFNIGSGKPTTINDLAKTVLVLAGGDSGVVHEKARIGDVEHSHADISKADKILGYRPKVGLEDGLRTVLGCSGDGSS